VTPEAAILHLRQRITAAERNRLRAEHERDSAQTVAAQALTRLQAEFGVSTEDEAQALLADLTAQRDAAFAELTARLDQAGV
jgi:hypothetical protein